MKREMLRKKFDDLESSRKSLVEELNRLDETILSTKPFPDKWSINQILYHLSLVEDRSLKYVKKKMQGGDSLKTSGFLHGIRSTFLKWLLLSGYKWKAPAVLGDVPENLAYAEVIDYWNKTRNDLNLMIESIPESLIHREIYKHLMAGRLDFIHMLHFFQDHFHHHLKQVNKLKADHSVVER